MKYGTYKTWITTGLMASVLTLGSAYAGSEQGTMKPANAQQQAEKNEAGKSQQLGKQNVEATGVPGASSNIILVGELVETRDVELKDSKLGSHRLLKVKPNGGSGPESVIVNIGRQDAASTFGLVKGDRVIAVGKAGRINDRPVLFAKSIGELYRVGNPGDVATQPSQIRQDTSARGAAAATRTGAGMDSESSTAGRTKPSPDPARVGQPVTPSANDGKSNTNPDGAGASRPNVDLPETRSGDEIVVWFESDNLDSDRYGTFDRDFVWFTDDPWYADWNSSPDTVAWNDNWETPHWDVWGYDDADEWGLWDW